MSYDVSVGTINRHLTWNGNQVYFDHLNKENGIRSLHDKSGQEAVPMIESFFESLREEEKLIGATDQVNKYNTSQGNNYMSMHLTFMFNLYKECLKHPDDIISAR